MASKLAKWNGEGEIQKRVFQAQRRFLLLLIIVIFIFITRRRY